MNDSYRSDPDHSSVSTKRGGIAPRVLLWVFLIVSATINVIANNIGGRATLLGMGAGAVAIGCIIGLVAHHFTRERS